jgi:hypothetical protein
LEDIVSTIEETSGVVADYIVYQELEPSEADDVVEAATEAIATSAVETVVEPVTDQGQTQDAAVEEVEDAAQETIEEYTEVIETLVTETFEFVGDALEATQDAGELETEDQQEDAVEAIAEAAADSVEQQLVD